MKFRSTTTVLDNLHLFLYGDGGAGKTKAIGDFHAAGESVVLVSREIDGTIPLHVRGMNVPHLIPETEDDLVGIILEPQQVTEKIIRKQPGFEAYEPKTWAFDGLRALQRTVMGSTPIDSRKVLNDQVELEGNDGFGVMRLPGKRPGVGVPSNLDYRILDLRMRNLVAAIELMPYHTIITAHYEKDFTIETHLEMTGDPKADKEVTRRYQGYPSLEGFSMKYDLPNLCSSFYLYLKKAGGKYTIQTDNTSEAKARTRIAEVMQMQLDWSGQNMYTLLQQKLELAKKTLGDKIDR